MQFRNGSNKVTVTVNQTLSKTLKKCDTDPGNDYTSVGEESMSRTRVFEWNPWFRAGQASIQDDQHTGRTNSSTTSDTVAKGQRKRRRVNNKQQQVYSKRILPGSPNSQFCTLL
jgi:hypothetical protein